MEFCNFTPTISVYRNRRKNLSLKIVLAQITGNNDLRLSQHVSICRSTILLIALNKKINKCIFFKIMNWSPTNVH